MKIWTPLLLFLFLAYLPFAMGGEFFPFLPKLPIKIKKFKPTESQDPENCADCRIDSPKQYQQATAFEKISEQLNEELGPACSLEKKDKLFLEEAKAQFNHFFPPIKGKNTKYRNNTYCGKSNEAEFVETLLGKTPSDAWERESSQRCKLANDDCIDTLCSLKIAYNSEEAALRSLVIAKRDGYAMSLDRTPYKSSTKQETGSIPIAWEKEHVRAADEVLGKMPANFKRLQGMKEFHRLPKEHDIYERRQVAGRALLGQGKIMLMSTAFNNGSQWLRIFIAHELAHHFDFQPMLNNSGKYFGEISGFNALSGWKAKVSIDENSRATESWGYNPEAKFVRDYAKERPEEDFADTFAHYIEFPQETQISTPEKYAFMKNQIFAGKEFLANKSWPALDHEIEALGGKDGMIQYCVEFVQALAIKASGTNAVTMQTQYINDASSLEEAALFFEYSPAPKCVTELANKLEGKLANHREFCLRGGIEGMHKTVLNKIKNPLQPILMALEKHGKKRGRSLDGLEAELRAAKGFEQLKPKTQNAIINHFSSLLLLEEKAK